MTPKDCQVTNVKMPSYDTIFWWSKKTALFGYSPLVSQLSLSSFASKLDMLYTSSWKLVSVSSFYVAVDGNVNKPLHLESVTSAVLCIT